MFDYSLGLNSTLTTLEVKTELLRLLGLRYLSEVSAKWPAMTVSVDDRKSLNALSLEIYAEELGVPPTTEVCYSVNYKIGDDKFGRAMDVMFLSAAQLVDRVDAVAVFPPILVALSGAAWMTSCICRKNGRRGGIRCRVAGSG